MQIQKTISSSVAIAGFLRQKSTDTNRHSTATKLKPVAEIVKTRADKQHEQSAKQTGFIELLPDDKTQSLQALAQKPSFGQFSAPKAYTALSAYATEQNQTHLEERAALSKILGVDYYV